MIAVCTMEPVITILVVTHFSYSTVAMDSNHHVQINIGMFLGGEGGVNDVEGRCEGCGGRGEGCGGRGEGCGGEE